MSKEVWDKPRPKGLGKPHHLSSKQKASAKASAKAAGRPYPNLVDNMRAAREDGGPVQYDTGPKPGEATLRPYNPTLPERFKNYLMGTNTAKPSPERRHFVEGLTEAVGMAPGVSNVLAGERLANAVAADDLLGAGAAAVGMIPGVGKYVGNKALQQIQKRVFAEGGRAMNNPYHDNPEVADALRLAMRRQAPMRLHQSLARTGYDDGGSVGNPIPADGAAPPTGGWNWQNNDQQFGFNMPRQGGNPQPDMPNPPPYDGGHFMDSTQPQPGTPIGPQIMSDPGPGMQAALRMGRPDMPPMRGMSRSDMPPTLGDGQMMGGDPIYQDYQNYLGRAPDQDGLNYWRQQLQSGAMNPQQIQQAIQNSAEAKNPETSNRSFLSNEYQQDLGRAPDQSGMQYWLNQLNSGAMNQQQVADAFRQSQERQNRPPPDRPFNGPNFNGYPFSSPPSGYGLKNGSPGPVIDNALPPPQPLSRPYDFTPYGNGNGGGIPMDYQPNPDGTPNFGPPPSGPNLGGLGGLAPRGLEGPLSSPNSSPSSSINSWTSGGRPGQW
jgi:hypothetical protein